MVPLMRIHHPGAAAVLVFALSPLQLCLNGFFDRLLCWLP